MSLTPNSPELRQLASMTGIRDRTLPRPAAIDLVESRLNESVIFAICQMMNRPFYVAFEGAREGITRQPLIADGHPGFRVDRITGRFTDMATGKQRRLHEQMALDLRIPVGAALLALALAAGVLPSDLERLESPI